MEKNDVFYQTHYYKWAKVYEIEIRERLISALGWGGSWRRLPRGDAVLAEHLCNKHLLSISHRCLGCCSE